MNRQPREERRRRVEVTLSARDRALLHALARFRIARTGDLVELGFAGVRRDTAARRLRRLFDAGYLDVRVGDRAAENVYCLGVRGKSCIEGQGGKPRSGPKGGLAHHLAIVRAWVSLAVEAHRLDGRLELFRPDWEIREDGIDVSRTVIPDALVEFQVRKTGDSVIRVRVALEVDLGTEGLATLGRKVERYRSLLGSGDGLFGWPRFGLALVLGGAGIGRREAVARLLDSEWPAASMLWDEQQGPRAALASIVGIAAPPLTDSPYGKGSQAAVTEAITTDADRKGRGL